MAPKETLYATVDDVFERLIFSKPKSDRESIDRSRISLDRFDDLFLGLLEPDRAEGSIFLIDGKADGLYRFDPNVLWPFSSQGIVLANDDWPPRTYQALRVENISTKIARMAGATHFSSKMARVQIASFLPNGRVETDQLIAAYVGNLWIDAKKFAARASFAGKAAALIDVGGGTRRRDVNNTIALSQSMALTHRYEWAVAIGFSDGPKVRLHSDPTGLRAMFRDRDKPETGDRRPALRHWVREHWRQSRNDEEAGHWVRRHLRGRIPFKWYGYDCEIRPSQFDLEEYEASTKIMA